MDFYNLTLSRSLFHSTGTAVAKPCLPLVFLGWTEETGDQFPNVRLLDLIRGKVGGWERFMALKLRRLYLI